MVRVQKFQKFNVVCSLWKNAVLTRYKKTKESFILKWVYNEPDDFFKIPYVSRAFNVNP